MKKISIKIIGQGHPLILIHGWSWNSAIWQPLVPHLKKHFQLHLVNIPFFDSYERISKQLFSVVPYKATWLGWSLGGMLAYWIAAYYPERITQLITIASSPRFIEGNNWPGIPLTTLEKFSQTLSQNQKKALIDFLELQLRGSEHYETIVNTLKPQLEKTAHSDLQGLLAGLTLLKESDLRNDLSKISCPSLHIFGQNDTLVPVEVAKLTNEFLPLSKCEIIKKSGHIPFLTHPEIFLELLSKLTI